MDVSGRTGDNLSSGFDLDTDMKEIDINIPVAVIWVSPYLTPSRYRTDKE